MPRLVSTILSNRATHYTLPTEPQPTQAKQSAATRVAAAEQEAAAALARAAAAEQEAAAALARAAAAEQEAAAARARAAAAEQEAAAARLQAAAAEALLGLKPLSQTSREVFFMGMRTRPLQIARVIHLSATFRNLIVQSVVTVFFGSAGRCPGPGSSADSRCSSSLLCALQLGGIKVPAGAFRRTDNI